MRWTVCYRKKDSKIWEHSEAFECLAMANDFIDENLENLCVDAAIEFKIEDNETGAYFLRQENTDKDKQVMLILTRRAGERILINDDICVTVLDSGDMKQQTKLGFIAPIGTRIYREEVYKKVQKAKEAKS